MVDAELRAYVEGAILPRYERFDAAHERRHVEAVIDMALALAKETGADKNMVYAVAAYHDIGMPGGRAEHHIHSARLLMEDVALERWFSQSQRETMRDAVEDHRASGGEPRSIYGKIVADADRELEPERIVYRTMAYGLSHYPALDIEGQIERAYAHISEKYGANGYLRLWLPTRENERRIEAVRALLCDRPSFAARFREALALQRGMNH